MAKAKLVLVSMTSNDVARAPGESASPEVGVLFHEGLLLVVRYASSSSPRLETFEDVRPPSMYGVGDGWFEVDDGLLESIREIRRRSAEVLSGLGPSLTPAIRMREEAVHAGHLRMVQDSRSASQKGR